MCTVYALAMDYVLVKPWKVLDVGCDTGGVLKGSISEISDAPFQPSYHCWFCHRDFGSLDHDTAAITVLVDHILLLSMPA
jgi:hypothetical protein